MNCRSSLNDKEQMILQTRLLSDEPQTLQDIADIFGISRERVRQIEVNLLKKMKKYLEQEVPDIRNFFGQEEIRRRIKLTSQIPPRLFLNISAFTSSIRYMTFSILNQLIYQRKFIEPVNNQRKSLPAIMLAVWFLGLSSHESHAQLFTVTPHDLLPEQKIVVDGKEMPQWKAVWDEARKSALQGDFEKALRQYKALLVLKSNLEEARWELARLMMYLKRWDEAAELLELLIESEPDSTLYINSLGKVMWEMGQYERAVDLFKRVYEKNPSDQTALAGLVEGLTKLDRKSEALPYLEQLSRQEPANRGVRRYLAFLLYEAGNYEKARPHLHYFGQK